MTQHGFIVWIQNEQSMTKRKRNRRTFTSEKKAEVLRAHFKDKKPVSEVCEEFGIQPSVFYSWRDHLFGHIAAAFESGVTGRKRATADGKLTKRAGALEAKLAVKDNVIAEISQEYVQLKKELGDP